MRRKISLISNSDSNITMFLLCHHILKEDDIFKGNGNNNCVAV